MSYDPLDDDPFGYSFPPDEDAAEEMAYQQWSDMIFGLDVDEEDE